MPTNRRTRAKRRNVSLQEYEIETLLLFGRDHFVARDANDPSIRETLKQAWRDPAVKARVLKRWEPFIEHDGPHCWAACAFDKAVEAPASIQAREARQRAAEVNYILNCCSLWQIDEALTADEKRQHADRIAHLRTWRTDNRRPWETKGTGDASADRSHARKRGPAASDAICVRASESPADVVATASGLADEDS